MVKGVIGSRFFREPLIILLAYFPYYFARHAAEDAESAFSNARHLMQIEASIGIFKELSFQSAAISYEALVHLFNIIYFYGHFPAIIVAGVYLLIRRPHLYSIIRNSFLISGTVALIFFALFPVAPPRLSTAGIVDTLALTVPISYDNSPLVNPYAALPSMHVGWALLVGLGLFLGTQMRLVRAVALMLPPSMLIATVITGNHFFIDGIAGSVVALLGFLTALWLHRHWPRLRDRLLARVRPPAPPARASA